MYMNKSEFINSIKDGALRGQAEYNILPSLTIAQAILESSWGGSQLTLKANNLFGMKAFSDWKGRRITLPTVEWYDNGLQVVNSDFRAYESLNESIEDHNKLLSYSRYKSVRECADYKSACEIIYECGYSTDPKYSEKLIRIIEENKLYEFDSGCGLSEASVGVEFEKVRSFQRLCNRLSIKDDYGYKLEEDNILGPRTLSCISRMPMLMEGTSGPAVEFIQKALRVEPVDGIFGPITRQCVMEFQKNNGIEVDGIAGHQTWQAMVAKS